MDTELTKAQIAEFKEALLELEQTLVAALDLNVESSKTVELDQQLMGRLSRMDAMQQQAMAKAGRRVQKKRLELTRQALRAIGEGTYGECRECGEWISLSRLEVKPEAPFCVGCQTARETVTVHSK